MEWHHFLWQLYESNQWVAQCRLGERAKPYSLSTCLLRIASQVAGFAFQVFGEFMKSVFFNLCLFSLSSSLALCSCSSRLLEWKAYALLWSCGAPSGLQTVLVWNDELWPQNKTESLHRSASMRTQHHRASAEICEDAKNNIRMIHGLIRKSNDTKIHFDNRLIV